MPYYTSDYLVEYKSGGSWLPISDDGILDVSGYAEQGLADNGVAFGDESITTCTIHALRTYVPSSGVDRLPLRVTFTINGSSAVAFVGEVAQRSGDLDTVTWDCESMLASLPGRTRDYYSPLRYRRPPATKTTASSVEDPDDGSYTGGLINELLWRAGGRPYEQAGSYASADFFYSCQQAIRAPDWSWVAGENGYEECKRLLHAVGGQIAAGMDGVIRYKSPMTFVSSVAQTYTLSDFDGESFSEQIVAGDQYAESFVMSYTKRRALNTQEVINDTTYRTIAAGESVTIDLETHHPIVEDSWVLESGTLKENNLTITFFDGSPAAYHASTGFTTTVETYAMRITIVITNNTARHMQVSKIIVSGQPVAPGEVETVTVGSGDPTRVLPDNDFVQSKAHALALATMALSFYGVARAVRTLPTLPYSVTRLVGDTVALTVSELGLSAAPHIILKKSHAETGLSMDLDVLDAAGLPSLSEYWLVQSTSQSGTKKIAW